MSRPPAVELAGYLDSAVGVGEAARLYVQALRSAGVTVRERDVPLPGRDSVKAETVAAREISAREIGTNVLCLNPEQMIPYLEGRDAPIASGRGTVGIWSWEVDVVPPGWVEAAEHVDELWTYSRFAADLIEKALGVPVVAMPPPVSRAVDRALPSVMLPKGLRVLVMFDYLSTLERKNPLGAIEAFRRAFDPNDGAVLVLKSVNARHRPERASELEQAIAGRADILMIDQTMSAAERDALIAASDCYLSLHRSEGHGLPLAEAMAARTPVVATAYGGNTEFMSEENSYLVAWSPALVGAGVEHYPADASWAEPDVGHAAALLRELHEDRDEARRRAQRAESDVMRLLAPEVIGVRMRRRLELLDRRGGTIRRTIRGLARRWPRATDPVVE